MLQGFTYHSMKFVTAYIHIKNVLATRLYRLVFEWLMNCNPNLFLLDACFTHMDEESTGWISCFFIAHGGNGMSLTTSCQLTIASGSHVIVVCFHAASRDSCDRTPSDKNPFWGLLLCSAGLASNTPSLLAPHLLRDPSCPRRK